MAEPSRMCWRSGNLLIVPEGMDLSGRCFKCGEPAVKGYKRKLYWHHPAFYILLFVFLPAYVIVALVARKTCSLKVGLCVKHKRNRNILFAISWGLLGLAIVSFFLSVTITFMPQSDGQLILIISGATLLITSLIMAIVVGSSLCYPSEITNRHGFVKGAGQPVLDDFAEFTGFKQ